MAVWKIIVYPFGMAFLSFLFVSWAGMLAFGPDPRTWFEWQHQLVSALGAGTGIAGYVGGMYVAMKANARLLP